MDDAGVELVLEYYVGVEFESGSAMGSAKRASVFLWEVPGDKV